MGSEQFWPAFSERSQYATLWKIAKLLTLAFPTSYLVEKGFSTVVQLLTKQRNRLNKPQGGDLRLLLTNMVPDVISLIQNNHTMHSSH